MVRTVCFTRGSITTGEAAENRLKAAPAWTEDAAERLHTELPFTLPLDFSLFCFQLCVNCSF